MPEVVLTAGILSWNVSYSEMENHHIKLFYSLLCGNRRISVQYLKGSKSDKTNYRPISLLSNMSKVLEKIVYKRLYEYLTEIICLQNRALALRKMILP